MASPFFFLSSKVYFIVFFFVVTVEIASSKSLNIFFFLCSKSKFYLIFFLILVHFITFIVIGSSSFIFFPVSKVFFSSIFPSFIILSGNITSKVIFLPLFFVGR